MVQTSKNILNRIIDEERNYGSSLPKKYEILKSLKKNLADSNFYFLYLENTQTNQYFQDE